MLCWCRICRAHDVAESTHADGVGPRIYFTSVFLPFIDLYHPTDSLKIHDANLPKEVLALLYDFISIGKQNLILTKNFSLKLLKASFDFKKLLIPWMKLHNYTFQLFDLETCLELWKN